MSVTLTVDGQQVEVPEGASVLDAINRLGITIPQLCKDPDQDRLGTCRTCLVEVSGGRGFPASCSTVAVDGMEVRTDSPELLRVRNGILQLTLDMVPEDDPEELGELGELASYFNLTPGRFRPDAPIFPRQSIDETNPIWVLDRERCILCQRCVEACHEVQHIYAISYLGHSKESHVGFFGDGGILGSNCTNCGQCWSVCPTLAIRQRQPLYAQGTGTA